MGPAHCNVALRARGLERQNRHATGNIEREAL